MGGYQETEDKGCDEEKNQPGPPAGFFAGKTTPENIEEHPADMEWRCRKFLAVLGRHTLAGSVTTDAAYSVESCYYRLTPARVSMETVDPSRVRIQYSQTIQREPFRRHCREFNPLPTRAVRVLFAMAVIYPFVLEKTGL